MFNSTIPLTISGTTRNFTQRNQTKDGYTVFAFVPSSAPFIGAHKLFARLRPPTQPGGPHQSEMTVKLPVLATSTSGVQTLAGTAEVSISARVPQTFTEAQAAELVSYISALATDGTLMAMVRDRSTIPVSGGSSSSS